MRLLLVTIGALWALGAAAQDRLQPRDLIRLSSPEEATMNGAYVVDGDGYIRLPGGIRISAGGVAWHEVQSSCREALKRAGYSVRGLAIERAGRRQTEITFSGAVLEPGGLPYRAGLRLSDVVLLASPTVAADLEAIVVTDAAGRSAVHRFVAPIGPGRDADLLLRPGDDLYFPLSSKSAGVAVLGEVREPGPVDFFPGLTARQAIALANGMTGNGDPSAVQIVRGAQVVDTLNLDLGYDTTLQRGDIVRVVARSNLAFVFVVGAVNREGQFAFRPGMRLTEALLLADGLAPNASRSEIYLLRRIGGTLRRLRQNLDRIAQGRDPNPILEPSDTVEVRPIRSGVPTQ